jgi:hypothetical protein
VKKRMAKSRGQQGRKRSPKAQRAKTSRTSHTGVEVIPSAKRLVLSMRDLGYDFSQAVSDLVDNSIEAGADTVRIDFEPNGIRSWVRIADNGHGMNREQLEEAMRFGADRSYRPDDLGKFGLGLKTASLSQCRWLIVASKKRGSSDIAAYSWDVRHIEQTNRWEILPVDLGAFKTVLLGPLSSDSGTVVLWQRLDRIMEYQDPDGGPARRHFIQMIRDLESHLAMVFHRFLSGEIEGKPLRLFLAGNAIVPWDPYCRSEARTRVLPPLAIPMEHDDASGDVVIEPYILPNQDEFSSMEAFRKASGPANWNQQQGLYIYRAGRMIQSGGWSGLRTQDEHTKLARVAVSFSPGLDAAFKVNVSKMRAQIPSEIRDEVERVISNTTKTARDVYDHGRPRSAGLQSTRATSEVGGTAVGRTEVNHHDSSPTALVPGTILSRLPLPETPLGPELMTFDEWADQMLRAATEPERGTVIAILQRLRAMLRHRGPE